MKILRVGDPHVKPSNLAESQSLLDFVFKTAKERQVQYVEFVGDLFDTHLVMRMDVMHFWQNVAIRAGQEQVLMVAIPGNHDQAGDRQREGSMSALDSFKHVSPFFKVFDKPTVFEGTAYIPYMSDEKAFMETALELLPKTNGTLVCHQTFEGSKFDNGMYAPHGFNVDFLKDYKQVISGHIHSTQKFANIFYIGTAKWESLSDANLDKGIWLFDGSKEPELISTSQVCQPIKLYEISELNPIEIKMVPGQKNYLVLKGTSSWISNMIKKYKGQAKITVRPTDGKNYIENREERISSLQEYAKLFSFDDKIAYQDVIKYIDEL